MSSKINRGTTAIRDLLVLGFMSLAALFVPETILNEFKTMPQNAYQAAEVEVKLTGLWSARNAFLSVLGLECLDGSYNVIDATSSAFFPSDEGIFVDNPLENDYNSADLYVFTGDRSGLQSCEKDASYLFALVYYPDSFVPAVLVLKTGNVVPEEDRIRYNNPDYEN